MTLSRKANVHNIATPPKEDKATAKGIKHKKFGEIHITAFRDTFVDRRTQRHPQTVGLKIKSEKNGWMDRQTDVWSQVQQLPC